MALKEKVELKKYINKYFGRAVSPTKGEILSDSINITQI